MFRDIHVLALAASVLLPSPVAAAVRPTRHVDSQPTTEAARRIRAYEAAFTAAHSARGTPAFARQTGLACGACHIHFPELTATGRAFKLNGYVFRRADSLQGRNPTGTRNLLLNLVTPLSIMMQTSMTSTAQAQPGTQNGTVFFPDQLSLFTGGEITPHVGAFLQVTFDPQSGDLGLDNADFRFADNTTILGRHTVYGVSLNNNPTVQDLWNSTPAWGFPYGSSDAAPTPAAATMIDGQLGQTVAGLTAYTMWNNALYLEGGIYRSAPVGTPRPLDSTATGVIRGVAPYWRVAVPLTFGKHYLSLGTYGMAATQYASGVSGPTNRFTDVAFDLAYLLALGDNSIGVDATVIHESQRWAAGEATNLHNSLTTMRLDAMYHLKHIAAFTAAPFRTTGTADAQLYGPAPVFGSATGKPDSDGIIGEVDVMPWQNLRLQLQYIAYRKFNGGRSNYDGAGRNASDNNTLYALAWILF